MTKRMISFTEPQYNRLRKRAESLGLSVSELVRRIVDRYLETKEPPDGQHLDVHDRP